VFFSPNDKKWVIHISNGTGVYSCTRHAYSEASARAIGIQELQNGAFAYRYHTIYEGCSICRRLWINQIP